MKKIKNALPVVFLVMIAIGVAIVIGDYKSVMDYKKNGSVDINTLALNEMEEDQPISGKVKECWDTFAEEYETNFGIRTSSKSTKLYYLLGLDDRYVIYETANKDEYDQLDKMAKELADFYNNTQTDAAFEPKESIEIEGTVQPVSDEVRKYCREYMEKIFDAEYVADEMAVVDVCMVRSGSLDRMCTAFYIGAGCAVVGLIGLIGVLIAFLRGRRSSSQDLY